MDAPILENLDLACARAGRNLARRPSREIERRITDAIAVLEEQGVYALFLFLESSERSERNREVSQGLCDLLKKTPRQAPLLSGNPDLFSWLQGMAEDLDKLLLVRDLCRQALIYARYHARLPEGAEVRS